MATIVIRHQVEDFDTWKQGYDDAEALRQENNIVRASVHRDPEDPKTVMAVHQFETMQDSRNFIEAVAPIMKDLGVLGRPEIWFGEDLD
jgi:hypothetical protein